MTWPDAYDQSPRDYGFEGIEDTGEAQLLEHGAKFGDRGSSNTP